jgi:hypothetical protein
LVNKIRYICPKRYITGFIFKKNYNGINFLTYNLDISLSNLMINVFQKLHACFINRSEGVVHNYARQKLRMETCMHSIWRVRGRSATVKKSAYDYPRKFAASISHTCAQASEEAGHVPTLSRSINFCSVT